MLGETIECIIQYLHYKYKYMNAKDLKVIPQFVIKPNLALNVLNATLQLNI